RPVHRPGQGSLSRDLAEVPAAMSKALKDPNDGPAPQNQDRIDFTKVIAVGVVSLIIFALSSWWAYTILRGERIQLTARRGDAPPPAEMGKPEIGIVDQVPFDKDHRLEVWKKDQKDRLESYGWIDRKRGLIHVPIEQAMAEVVAGAAPGPAAVPAAAQGANK